MKTISSMLLMMLVASALACGYGSKNYPAVAGSMPAIAQLTPASVTAGGPAFTLSVNGTNFAAQAVINWNGIGQTANTTYVNATQLTMSVPAGMIANSGTVQVSVTNPGTPGTGMYGGTTAATSVPVNLTIN